MSETRISTPCECTGCNTVTTMVPVTGFGLGLDLSGIQGGAIKPGPEGTHLVTRNGQLVWETIIQDGAINPGSEGTHLVTRNGQLVWEAITPAGSSQQAPENLYVSVTGDDANDGLTPETQLKTVMAALDKTIGYARSPHAITINVASGTYTENITVDFSKHYQNLLISGAGTRPVLDGNITAKYHGRVDFDNIHSKSAGVNFSVIHYAVINLRRCDVVSYGSAHDMMLYAASYGSLFINGPVDIDCSSGTNTVFRALRLGTIEVMGNAPITVKGTVRSGTARTWMQGQVLLYAADLRGTVTGKRYTCSSGGLIVVPTGKEDTFIPGTIAGAVATGGLYVGG